MHKVLSTHIELTLLLLQQALWKDVSEDILEFVQKHSIDWNQIIDFSDKQNITDILSYPLSSFSTTLDLPKELSKKWDKTFQSNNTHTQEIKQVLTPIIEICRDRQIPIIPFKEIVYNC